MCKLSNDFQVEQVVITKYSDKGVGIAFFEDKELYIKNTIVGEKVLVHVLKPFVKGSKRYECELVKIIIPSTLRVTPLCPHYSKCGACQLMHLSTVGQNEYKTAQIKEAIKQVTKESINYLDFYSIDKPYVSRHKSIRNFALNNGHIISGFYQNYSHEVVSVDTCILEDPKFGVIALEFTFLFNQYLDSLIVNGELILRNLLLRSYQDEIMAVLIVKVPLDGRLKIKLVELAQSLKLTTLVLGVNTSNSNKILADTYEVLVGPGNIYAKLLGLSFKVSPNSFLQVNYQVTNALYQQAIDFCKTANNHDLALDLCCGVGTMTLALAKHFEHVIGVEIVDDAIVSARDNAVLNQLDNVKFISSDLTLVIDNLVKLKPSAIIADPSRIGLGSKNIKAIAKIKGNIKVAVIFCSLKALVRDLKEFLSLGFKIEAVRGFDMFVHTTHVETLVLLSKH